MYVHARPALSKRAMLANLGRPVAASKIAARNTLDYTLEDGTRKIRLHDTDILTFHPTGLIEINTGGFNTVTTRSRMNEFLPAGSSVYTERGVIHLRALGMDKPFTQTAVIDVAKARVLTDAKEGTIEGDRKALDGFMKAWRTKGLPTAEKSQGDPWAFPNQETGKVEESVVRDWIETQYVFRSFYIMALRFAGIQDRGIGMYMDMIDRKGGKLDRIDYSRIRRYARACIGYAS